MENKKRVVIITATDIYSRDSSVSFKFMFDSGMDFEKIRGIEKYGMIKKDSEGRWFITAGHSGEQVFSGGYNVIRDDCFYDTVYLMKEDEYYEFEKDFIYDIDHEVFHSKKVLYQN